MDTGIPLCKEIKCIISLQKTWRENSFSDSFTSQFLRVLAWCRDQVSGMRCQALNYLTNGTIDELINIHNRFITEIIIIIMYNLMVNV